jgi:hypothetical protein
MENQGANISKCNNDRQWSVYCFKVKVCQIQVLHSYRNDDGNKKFEKMENRLKWNTVT